MSKKRITVRLDNELCTMIEKVKNINLINLSALIRETLRRYVSNIIDIDNSGEQRGLEKDEEKNS